MALFNYAKKEITLKIVYYGPGLGGKTTSLRFIYDCLPSDNRSKMISLATNQDRTLFFDFLPLEVGTLRGMKLRLQLYTVPGQVYYNSTRKIVLKGADGVVFVADSQDFALEANVESWKNLKENLVDHGEKLVNLPHVIQYNKRDLPNITPIDAMEKALNEYHVPSYETIATTGYNILEALTMLTKMVVQKVIQEHGLAPDDRIDLDKLQLIPQTQKRRVTMVDFSDGSDDLWEEEEEFEFEEVKAPPPKPTPSPEPIAPSLDDTVPSETRLIAPPPVPTTPPPPPVAEESPLDLGEEEPLKEVVSASVEGKEITLEVEVDPALWVSEDPIKLVLILKKKKS